MNLTTTDVMTMGLGKDYYYNRCHSELISRERCKSPTNLYTHSRSEMSGAHFSFLFLAAVMFATELKLTVSSRIWVFSGSGLSVVDEMFRGTVAGRDSLASIPSSRPSSWCNLKAETS